MVDMKDTKVGFRHATCKGNFGTCRSVMAIYTKSGKLADGSSLQLTMQFITFGVVRPFDQFLLLGVVTRNPRSFLLHLFLAEYMQLTCRSDRNSTLCDSFAKN